MKPCLALKVMIGLLGISLFAGCQPENYRWQTVIHEDGSVTRSISQPQSKMAPKILHQTQWQRIRAHREYSRSLWPGRITDSRFESSSSLSQASDEESYLLAEGTFQTLDQVPQHYRFELEGTDFASELKHNLIINDYGLVKEYIWTEVITDIVVYEKIPAARRETIELIVKLIEDGLQPGLGDDYNVTPLVEWVTHDGNEMLEELTMLILSPDIRTLEEEARKKRFEAVVIKYGMTDISEKGMEEFLRLRLKTGIRTRDGMPITEETVTKIVENLKNNKDTPIGHAMDNAFKKHCGEGDEASAKLAELAARQVGIHGVPMLGPPQLFDVWMKLPGEIVETNGTLGEEGFLSWSFSDEDIWPTGYQMTARSLLAVKKPQASSLNQSKLNSQSQLLTYFRLVSSDPELKETVENCLAYNSLHHLKEIENKRYKLAGSPQNGNKHASEERADWWRARQLLDLLSQDPPASDK